MQFIDSSGEVIMGGITSRRQSALQDYRVAVVLFGMSKEVAELVAILTPPQIDRIAERYSYALRMRWEGSPEFSGATPVVVAASPLRLRAGSRPR